MILKGVFFTYLSTIHFGTLEWQRHIQMFMQSLLQSFKTASQQRWQFEQMVQIGLGH
jgi:hypothetical protein